MEEKLNNFYNAAIEDAKQQSVDIIEEYKNSLQQIFTDHKTEAMRKKEAAILAEEENCIRERNRILSGESIEIRKRASDKAKELIDILYADVEMQLVQYMKTPDYLTFLEKQIEDVKKFSKGDAITLYINPTDSDKKDRLEEKTGAQLTISATDFLGGTRAVIHTKHILIDNSFSTQLSEGKETFTL